MTLSLLSRQNEFVKRAMHIFNIKVTEIVFPVFEFSSVTPSEVLRVNQAEETKLLSFL